MTRTVNVPDDWTPPNERKKQQRPQWAFDVGEPNTTAEADGGWRLVGVDEYGQKLYAPPPRYSIWFS